MAAKKAQKVKEEAAEKAKNTHMDAERIQRLKNFKKENKDTAKAFEAPVGLSFVFDLFKGVKVNIRNIHIRYEDDIFSKE